MGSNINSNPFNSFLANSRGQVPAIIWPVSKTPANALTGLPSDTFTSAANRIQSTFGGNAQPIIVLQPTSNFAYNPQDGIIYSVSQNADGSLERSPTFAVMPGTNQVRPITLNFPFPAINQVPAARDPQGRIVELNPNDQLVFDQNSGKLFIRHPDGTLTDVTEPQGDLAVNNLPPLSSEADTQGAALRISQTGQIWEALNLPHGLYSGPVDVTGMVPSLGDQTGITIQAGILASAGLYTQLQRTLSIINYLNTAPNGTQPNPQFSYLPGHPPYGQDTPEGKREQAKVFAQLKTTIIAQLVRITDQLRAANNGLKQQTDLANSQLKSQNQEVQKWVNNAGGGGGGG